MHDGVAVIATIRQQVFGAQAFDQDAGLGAVGRGADGEPLKIWLGDQRLQQLCSHALIAPPAKAPVHVFPVPIIRR
ncbi:hypothetical protein SAMN05421644_1763 [Allochromatium warmingii]|uniref:Uncharacterized protein n=1 Tax=Allochromatium warmingii TaxID=61595 RepID=A0A1H3K5I9_ALLWA|nr:hypothetical protein SAMN05421644_1763 [Allochromatium warmingii]